MRIAFQPIPDSEIKAALKNMSVVVDTRENENSHIMDYLKAKKIPTVHRKLDFGDYSLEIPLSIEGLPPKVSLEKRIVIERKHSIDEIATNLGTDRERFEREMIRIKAAGAKCVLMLENFSFDRVLMGADQGGYRSRMPGDQIALLLNQFMIRYDLQIIPLNDRINAGRMLVSVLARHAYEYLKES